MELYIKEEWRVPAVGAISFAVGTGVGYFICNRRWAKVGRDVVDTMDNHSELLEEMVEDEDPSAQLALDFARAAEDNVRNITAQQPVVVEQSLVQPPEDDYEVEITDWNQQEEEEDRGPDAPYVIHKEEFFTGVADYSQSALEYFADDNILCDDKRVPIYNPEKVVGRLEFGHGSGDSDVVYIRNEKNHSDYEVTRNHGSYQAEVLGLEAEEDLDREQGDLQHSVRRFRMDD